MRFPAILVTVLIACGTSPNDVGPGGAIGPGVCTVAQFADPLPDVGECVLTPEANPATPCQCSDYAGEYPAGVYDAYVASVSTVAGSYPDAERDGDGRILGCSADIRYAMPDCTTLAMVSGTVATAPEFETDDDLLFNMCPIDETMRAHPFESGVPFELRGHGSFFGLEGRLHIEVQRCRLSTTDYTITEPGQPPVTMLKAAWPVRGDLISTAGDWIWDYHHRDEGGGWTEIHEARAFATTRSLSPVVSYSFASMFFADKSLQKDNLLLDIKVPAPTVAPPLNPADFNLLECYIPDNIPSERPDPKVPGQTIAASEDPIVTGLFNMAPGALNAELTQLTPVDGVCRFELRRTATTALNSFNCQGTCDGDLDKLDFRPLAAATAIRAQWFDPGDTWVCQNCSCADPSAVGATIAAPVQGCATAGLDPSNPDDQATACAQVCGGFVCGEAPACRIDACTTPTASPSAVLVGRSTCDPTVPIPLGRVAPAGDYHVTIDSAVSTVKIIIDDHSTTQPAFGEFHFNRDSTDQVLDFASSLGEAPPFTIRGRDVTEGRVFTVQRMFAQRLTGNDFFVPAGIGVFGVRGLVDGKPKGINTVNLQPLFGSIDVENRHFVLDVDASNPDGDQRLIAHLEGTIDNLPPVADAGAATRTVECSSHTTTPVPLSGSASSDPDPGDVISHYQWFDAFSTGLGNTETITAQLHLGLTKLFLHVYDHFLGSGSTEISVRVVDTTPPALSVQPADVCIFPPNHKRVRFALNKELAVSVQDICDPSPQVKIVSVTSNEPDNGLGDGDRKNDIAFSDSAACVRRERSGNGTGRTYTIVVEASDASGNTTRRNVTVRVPANSEPGCRSSATVIPDLAACE